MFQAIESPFLVPFDGSFDLAEADTAPGKLDPGKKQCKKLLEKRIEEIAEQQARLYAQDRFALLLVFQAMDAAGKDGTIRAVMSGINPAGCQVYSFKQPSKEELDHDFLWRTARSLPERGRVGIFNRSYYEEVLVVRVHPEYLKHQRLPFLPDDGDLWAQRLDSIRDHEKHLARNGTIILKFWLNVSRKEQKSRFLARIDEPKKNWKFSASDIEERQHWDKYMEAYEETLNATSCPWAPWYAIPADDKPFLRVTVAGIISQTLESLDLHYPTLPAEERSRLEASRKRLEKE